MINEHLKIITLMNIPVMAGVGIRTIEGDSNVSAYL